MLRTDECGHDEVSQSGHVFGQGGRDYVGPAGHEVRGGSGAEEGGAVTPARPAGCGRPVFEGARCCHPVGSIGMSNILPTVPTFAVRETDVSRHNGGHEWVKPTSNSTE